MVLPGCASCWVNLFYIGIYKVGLLGDCMGNGVLHTFGLDLVGIHCDWMVVVAAAAANTGTRTHSRTLGT